MNRQNLFTDEPWDDEYPEERCRARVFWRPDNARMGASLWEFDPGGSMRLHMHYGAEEMFFVVSGRPTFGDGRTEEELSPGAFLFCPEGRPGLHEFVNRTDEPARILAMSAGSFPDVVAYPAHGYAWVATRDPELQPEGDPGLIVRFEIPTE